MNQIPASHGEIVKRRAGMGQALSEKRRSAIIGESVQD
jgi:hypothetical protein